jgi:hypothetical protein
LEAFGGGGMERKSVGFAPSQPQGMAAGLLGLLGGLEP